MSSYDDPPQLPEDAFPPQRQRVDLSQGALVQSGEQIYRIKDIIDFESVMAVEVESGRSTMLRLGELRPVSSATITSDTNAEDLDEIEDSDWREAERRYRAIQPLLASDTNERQTINACADAAGVNAATIYRWLKRYRSTQVLSALIPQKRGWTSGRIRISAAAEAVIDQVITDFYLTPQRPSAQKAILEVMQRCFKRGIEQPHPSTVRARLAKVSERQRLRGRGYGELAKNKFMPAPGSFPNADFPLSVIQIDHTPVDIILVDDTYRKPIQRPWITLAMDVHSRMITGYYLSFDPPSETSVAMCVAHSILPKDEWMLLHSVDATWPVWGVPKTIHVDNGADFRSNTFRQACLQYGINLEYRPVKQPRYGGHIERLLGTLLREIHNLPGTTFSSIKDREGYNSEKHAVMTKSEFEGWLVALICKVYHAKLHSGIGMTPMRKWDIGIFGNSQTPGSGLPAKLADRKTVLLDFLPCFRRTIQPVGVTIDNLTYYAEALRHWIGAESPDQKGKKREFVFRRDPRDITAIWFFDPVIKQYFMIPTADQSLPPMSIWEYQQARNLLKKEGSSSVNTVELMSAIEGLRTRVDESSERTKSARRMRQRRKEHEKKLSPAAPRSVSSEPKPSQLTEPLGVLADLDEITPFGDIA